MACTRRTPKYVKSLASLQRNLDNFHLLFHPGGDDQIWEGARGQWDPFHAVCSQAALHTTLLHMGCCMPEKTSFSLARMEHGQVGSSKFGAFSVLSLLSLSLFPHSKEGETNEERLGIY
jgi:hypothetical protein